MLSKGAAGVWTAVSLDLQVDKEFYMGHKGEGVEHSFAVHTLKGQNSADSPVGNPLN